MGRSCPIFDQVSLDALSQLLAKYRRILLIMKSGDISPNQYYNRSQALRYNIFEQGLTISGIYFVREVQGLPYRGRYLSVKHSHCYLEVRSKIIVLGRGQGQADGRDKSPLGTSKRVRENSHFSLWLSTEARATSAEQLSYLR